MPSKRKNPDPKTRPGCFRGCILPAALLLFLWLFVSGALTDPQHGIFAPAPTDTPVPTLTNPQLTQAAATETKAQRSTDVAEKTQAAIMTLTQRADDKTSTAYYQPLPTSVAPPVSSSNSCPKSCSECVKKGWSAQQCGQCPNLDRDHDGVACYGN
jgi:hypothetical protein